jgi:hypothetical protein
MASLRKCGGKAVKTLLPTAQSATKVGRDWCGEEKDGSRRILVGLIVLLLFMEFNSHLGGSFVITLRSVML